MAVGVSHLPNNIGQYCIDKELYKAIDYLREQVRVFIEHLEQDNKRILPRR